ncbi:hypothetical protein CFP56_033937 [Quercus suber]|uniref:CCHC-type domain-containing protein n=1 Tax=Quercus suber TaxID=58331 RepID=A0AAW0JDJ8_QUESU
MTLHGMQLLIIGFIIILVEIEASRLSCMKHCGPLQIPYPFGTSGVAKEIVSIAGNVDSRASEEGCGNAFNFIRLRVAVDTPKPLCRGRKIAMANGKEGWVSFKYERLPNICYQCGKLTHSDKDCPLWEQSRGTLRGRDQQFGAWLRASTPNLSRRTVIRVAGIKDDERSEGGDLKGDNELMESMLRRNGGDDTEQGVESVVGPMDDLPIINAILQYPEGSNGTNTDMETNLNSLTVSHLVNNVQEADF